MPNPAQPSPTPSIAGAATGNQPASEHRPRRWLWYVLTAGLIALLFAGHLVAGTYIKSRARQSIADREPQVALEWLKWAATLNRSDAEAEFLRARACRKLGEFNQVREHLTRAFKLGYSLNSIEREQVLALAQAGQMRDAEPSLGGLLTDPQGDAQEICEAFVHGFLLNRRYSEAFELLTPWIADYPRSPQPYYIRGHMQVMMQRYHPAVADFRKALALDPGHDATIFELADVLDQLHQPDEALTYYSQARKYPRFEMMAGVGESRSLKILGRSDEARTVIQQVLAKFPDEPLPHQALGQIELEAGNYEEALKHLDIAVVKLGYDIELRNARGAALRSLKRLKEANQEFDYVKAASRALNRAGDLRELVQTNPNDYKSRYEIGLLFLKYYQPQEGVIWLQSVFNFKPDHRGAHQALADYYASREKEDPKFHDLAEQHRKAAAAAPADEADVEPAKKTES